MHTAESLVLAVTTFMGFVYTWDSTNKCFYIYYSFYKQCLFNLYVLDVRVCLLCSVMVVIAGCQV